MASKLIITLLGVALLSIFSSTDAVKIGGDVGSLLLIVGKLCLPGNHNDDVSKAFFDCYDRAPGKELFVKCQVETFGFTLDTNAHITSACIRAYKMLDYGKCLKKEFTAAGADQDAAVTQVNICQGAAVGLN